MDLIPHTGELLLMLGVVALIFGLGRLPQISFALASLGRPQPSPGSAATSSPAATEPAAPSDDEPGANSDASASD